MTPLSSATGLCASGARLTLPLRPPAAAFTPSSIARCQEDIHMCLYSMCDNDSFLNSNRLPIDKMIGYLKRYFSPENIQEGYSLAIVAGEEVRETSS
jgi:Protein of unknown function (DUF2009)